MSSYFEKIEKAILSWIQTFKNIQCKPNSFKDIQKGEPLIEILQELFIF